VEFSSILNTFLSETGFLSLTLGAVVMMSVGACLIYLGIKKEFEPLLLVPIGFGAILTNLPLGGVLAPPTADGMAGSITTSARGSIWRSSPR
jgi:Na+-transporting methylmalonyl-CoA/oxaloacetate decarboxylase beta subunit